MTIKPRIKKLRPRTRRLPTTRTHAGRKLHVGGPNVGSKQIFDRLVEGIFKRRWFTNGGKVVREFEARLCEFLDVKHCIPVCNATMGLQLACHALDLTGEIILPAFTFVATPHAVRWERLTPVFADVDTETHTLDPRCVEELISDQTSAIIGVHLWGTPCQVQSLQDIARRNNLRLVFDAAHAFGCKYKGQMIGNFGDCEVFSFHATKFFNTFEGGAIATNDDQLADKIRLMKNFGFAGMDQVVHLGTNAKMPEICAAMGLSMFPVLQVIQDLNRHNYELYMKLLQDVPGLRLFPLESLERTNWQYVVVEVFPDQFGVDRDSIFRRLHEHDVRARRYFYPGCHRMEPYQSEFSASGRCLPNTDALCERTLCLPTGSSIEPADIVRICSVICSAN